MSDEEKLISIAVANWQPRFLAAGVDVSDLSKDIIPKASNWQEWYKAWCEVGARHEAIGEEALKGGNDYTAGQAFAKAAVYYHFSQFTLAKYPDLKKEGTTRKIEVYKKAAPRLLPYARRIEIPFEGEIIPAYLRVPFSVVKPPVVLLIPGADSVKEEFRTLEEVLLIRGMATLSMDGPGQGEMRYHMLMRPDYNKAVSAVIDFLNTQPYLDSGRIAGVGISMGGTFIMKAAAEDNRIKAAVDIAGPYHIDYWDQCGPILKETITFLFDAKSEEEAQEKAYSIDIREAMPKVKCPILIVHGQLDRIVPLEDANKMYQNAECEKELLVYPEGNHVCNNIVYKYRPYVGDWVKQKLG